MTVKVLITALGQHMLAGVKQVENTETGEVLAYWVSNPVYVEYSPNEEGGVSINFSDPCPLTSETEYSVRADFVVSILDPKPKVLETYSKLVNPEPTEIEVEGSDEQEETTEE